MFIFLPESLQYNTLFLTEVSAVIFLVQYNRRTCIKNSFGIDSKHIYLVTKYWNKPFNSLLLVYSQNKPFNSLLLVYSLTFLAHLALSISILGKVWKKFLFLWKIYSSAQCTLYTLHFRSLNQNLFPGFLFYSCSSTV